MSHGAGLSNKLTMPPALLVEDEGAGDPVVSIYLDRQKYTDQLIDLASALPRIAGTSAAELWGSVRPTPSSTPLEPPPVSNFPWTQQYRHGGARGSLHADQP